jgi:hypothetical protein
MNISFALRENRQPPELSVAFDGRIRNAIIGYYPKYWLEERGPPLTPESVDLDGALLSTQRVHIHTAIA